MEEIKEAKRGVQWSTGEPVNEGEKERREWVWWMGKDELFGTAERKGSNGGASRGDCAFQSFGREVYGFERGLEGGWEFAAEGGVEALAEIYLRQGFRYESRCVLQNL